MSEEATPDPAAAAAAPKASSPWPPVIAVLVLMPAISFGMTQYLIVPKIKGTIAEQQLLKPGGAKPAGPEAKEGAKGAHPAGKEGGKGEAASGKFSYDFDNIVVNLSGSMGSRYLKVSFTSFSANPDLKKLIDENKKQLLDVAIGVLGSRSMADLETPGAKNIIRNDLMANFNQALSSDLIEQVYFSEFVVQ
jgi:flagellar FliL protein